MTPDKQPHILIPLPDNDFDPTESATPWKVFTDRGWRVTFATEHGVIAAADPRLLMGVLRGPLGAGSKGLTNYKAMRTSPEYHQPIRYAEINPDHFDAVALTGGHAPGMKQYLESEVLQSKMVDFWLSRKVIGAICHGVLVLARAIDPTTGKSILYGSKVTALTKDLEISGYLLTFWLLGRRYRTYECYVADEVRGVLASPKDFKHGKAMFIPYTYIDHRLITSRWPLDAMQYSEGLAALVEQHNAQGSTS